MSLATSPTVVLGEELDSEHLFGFTEGTDIGEVGDKELELESGLRLGKRTGSYSAFTERVEGKFTIADGLRIAPGFAVSRHDISGVTGLDDRRQWAFEGLSFEAKYQLLDRARNGFGLTFGALPSWSRIDDIGGERVNSYASVFSMLVDKELVPQRVFGAFNLRYELAATQLRATGQSTHDSTFEASASLAGQVYHGVFVGSEVRYARAYDGLGLDAYRGDALFFGPTFYAKISERLWMAAGWNVQIQGRALDDPGRLDLVNFERHQAKIRFGYSF